MKERVFRTLLCCFAAALSLTLCAWAADTVDSGTCGENLTWTLDSDGVLTISGKGTMDWSGRYSPWVNSANRNGIETAIINSGVTSISNEAFSGCYYMTNVIIPDSVTSIGYGAFYDCQKLTSITIPNGVTAIGDGMFSQCFSLTSVMIPDSVTTIGKDAFYFCENLTSVIIPNSVTSINEGAFQRCNALTSLTIPDSVTYIEERAFCDCGLTNVTIPAGVGYIGKNAFEGCHNLTDIYYGGSSAQWSELGGENSGYEWYRVTIHYNAQDIGIGITLTDENGEAVDEKQNAFQAGDELTAQFDAVGLINANIFVIFYDKDGLMVSLESKEIDLSDPFNLMFVLDITIPEGAKTLKFLILGDNFEPLRAARMIESSADG